MTSVDDLSGAGEVVEAKGRAWTLSVVGPALKGRFVAELKAKARRGLEAERKAGILTAAQYREEADALKRQFDAGTYEWGAPFHPDAMGEAVLTAINSLEGKVRLLQILLEEHHGQVSPAEAFALLEDEADARAVAQAMQRCLDPNRQRPATNGTTTTPPTTSTPA